MIGNGIGVTQELLLLFLPLFVLLILLLPSRYLVKMFVCFGETLTTTFVRQ